MNKDIIIIIIIIIATHCNDSWDTHRINKPLWCGCGYNVWNIVFKESAWRDENTWCNAFLGIHPLYLSTLFNPKYPHTNSPKWTLYICLKNQLREFGRRSKIFFFIGDRSINSHNLSFLLCIGIVRRKLMLITLGTYRANFNINDSIPDYKDSTLVHLDQLETQV